MANIKSAKKRILVNNKKTEINKSVKSELKTIIKKFRAIVAENKKEEAIAMLNTVFSKLDSAAKTNLIHKNAAARQKAKLAKLINKIA